MKINGEDRMLKLYRLNISSSKELVYDKNDVLSVVRYNKLGSGRMCEAWRGKVYVPDDQLRDGNPVVIKRIIKKQSEDDTLYKEKVFEYLKIGQAYNRMYNQNPRGTSKVEGAFTDEEYYYILQVFLPGTSYANLKFQNRELERELGMSKKVIEIVSTYHNVRDSEGRLEPQFIGDLKPENFYAPMRDENDTPDLVYFDFDVFDAGTASGVHSLNERYIPYLQSPDSDVIRRKNDVTCIVLMLYERLIVYNQKGELPKKRKRVGRSRLPIGDFIIENYDKTTQDVNVKLKKIFQKGLNQEYRNCEELYEDIVKLISFVHHENELLAPIPEIIDMPIGREKIIENINNTFSGNKKNVYVYGIGGIGKTSVALKYSKMQNAFSRCFFVKFSKDIKTTIVENMVFSDYEDVSDKISNNVIYQSKMEFLRKYDSDSLLIIDDLYDANKTLDEIRNTPEFVELCGLDIRILFTTRYNMRLEGIRVDALSADECEQLFFNNLGNQNIPKEILCKLIDSVNSHTMMIKLIARTLQVSNLSPGEMLKIIKSNNFDSADVAPIKIEEGYISSEERQEKKILEHLQDLFDLAGFSDLEKYIMNVLGFVPGVSIHLDTLCELLVNKNSFFEIKQACLKLIDLGWIQTEDFESVSVHSLIAQMISVNLNVNVEISSIFKNWLIEKYNVYKKKSFFSYGIIRILRLIILEQSKNKALIVKRIIDETIHKPLFALVAYELCDNFTAEKITKEAYGDRKKPITFMVGQGDKTNNCYIFVYDGSQIIDAELLPAKRNVKWKGQVIWCWDGICTSELNEFHFASLIKYQTNDTVDIIEITEITRRCFANNRSIAYFEWGITQNEETGEFVGLTKIGESAFENSCVRILRCDSSEIVRIEDRTFNNCENLTSLYFLLSPITEFGREVFANCWKLEDIIFNIISNDNREIEVETGAFFLCKSLKNIGNKNVSVVRLKKVEKDAFYNCSDIEHIEFQIAAEEVGDSAFEGCKKMRRIKFFNGVKHIGKQAFQECSEISEVHFPDTIEVIEKYAFEKTKLKDILIEGNIRQIEYGAFDVSGVLQTFCVRSNGERGNASLDFVNVPVINYIILENINLAERAFRIRNKTAIGYKGSIKVDDVEANDNRNELKKAFYYTLQCIEEEEEESIPPFDEEEFTWLSPEEDNPRQAYKEKLLELGLNGLYFFVVVMIPVILLCLKHFIIVGLVVAIYAFVLLLSKIADTEKYEKFMRHNLIERKIKELGDKHKIGVSDFESDSLFGDMENQELYLPDTVIEIQEHAFSNKKMKYIEGNSVIKISQRAFKACYQLKLFSFTKLQFIGKEAMSFCYSLEKINMPNIKIIGKGAFDNCTNLTEVIVGNNLEKIEEAAFQECERIKSIELPDTVIRIGEAAFARSGLKNIVLPSMINIVEAHTFENTPLEKVVLLNHHVSIAACAFFQCEKLENISWDHIDSISEDSFRSCAFVVIRLANISFIPKRSFAYNKHLEKVEFVKNNIVLDDKAFWGDFLLHSISSRYITSIGRQALAYTNVEVLWFENLCRIGEQAFVGAKRLKNIFIKCSDDSLRVEKRVFDECIALQQVWIYFDGNIDIEIDAFPEIGYSIYVLNDSALDRWAKENSITAIVSVTPEVMERKWKEFLLHRI